MKTNARNLHRVIATLNREDIDYLDTIGKDSLFTTGVKLSRIKTLRAMIEAMRELGISGQGIKNEKGLKDEILKKVSSYKEGMMKLADKAKDITLIALLTLGILLAPVASAYCAPRSASKTITLRVTVVPKAELRVNEEAVNREFVSLNSREWERGLLQKTNGLTVERVHRDGMPILLLTKVLD